MLVGARLVELDDAGRRRSDVGGAAGVVLGGAGRWVLGCAAGVVAVGGGHREGSQGAATATAATAFKQ